MPAEWRVVPLASGGVRFDIRQDARPLLVTVPIALGLVWVGLIVRDTMVRSALPLGITPPLAWGFGAALFAFATWCAIAAETWEAGPGRLEHRLAFGPWARVRQYRPGTFAVHTGTDNHGWPYYRVVLLDAAGNAQWVMDRNAAQSAQVAKFLGFHTGWPVMPG